ncbi:endopeptidase La [bacterium]|nr:endopeptidase La [bacterium]
MSVSMVFSSIGFIGIPFCAGDLPPATGAVQPSDDFRSTFSGQRIARSGALPFVPSGAARLAGPCPSTRESDMEAFESAILPVMPLKDAVLFPSAITPLFVIRQSSLHALEAALKADKRLFITCQRSGDVENPGKEDLYDVGTVGEILQVLRIPDGSAKILVEGIYAARAIDYIPNGDLTQALLVRLDVGDIDDDLTPAYRRATLTLFERFVQLSDKVPEELYQSIRSLEDPLSLVHAITNYSTIGQKQKQQILESHSLEEKFMLLNSLLEKENQVLEMEGQIVSQVKTQIGRSQREYFLNEQLKTIERELGIGADENQELEELREQIERAALPKEAHAKAEKELARLARMAPMSPEATVSRTYIEWLTEIPWHKRTNEQIDLHHAREILDQDHFGLEKVKERIIEFLAVAKLSGGTKGPLLCLVGPPGVGKTSLARSIARSIGREFVRIALGGVRDEAEIRGHRRTYIGALPGKLIQSMKRAGTINPVLLLDEIDKMSSDFRGDPSSAMLEVLDPEQNKAFNDHYIEVDYDLSQVLFVATANTTAEIPLPLQDRLEIIRLSGYTDLEKVEIATRHLVPRAIKDNGLKRTQVGFDRKALLALINGYTREAGVRNLEREIQTICRKIATQVVSAAEESKSAPRTRVTPAVIRELLGPEKFKESARSGVRVVGNTIGLAWTEVGGEILNVEVRSMAGKGDLILTGKLGDVMKESARTALSYIRSLAPRLRIDSEQIGKLDIHIHLPEGAIPKDGPSAGITLAASLASSLSGIPARQDVAMTGEVTLHGRVLKIGGLKEKVLAAHRNGIRTIIIPEDNVQEIDEIPTEVRKKVAFRPVGTLEQVLEIVLGMTLDPAAAPTAKLEIARKLMGGAKAAGGRGAQA